MQKEPFSPSHETTPTTPEGNEFTYELLTGHRRTDGTYKSDLQLRMEYITLTDKLIHQMTDGLEVLDPETGEKEVRVPDTVIFLDKSARPLAWLTKELWERLAADPATGETPDMPDFRFLNIDREQWINTVDQEGKGYADTDRVDPSIIRSLRSIFVNPNDKKDGLTPAIDTAPAGLDHKTVMIVDEVRATGRTLDIATRFVQKAFPTAAVGGTHWMQGITHKGQATGNADLPVWYKNDDVYGRGVGDRDAASQTSTSDTQRLGAWFLSTRLPREDIQALRLRKEFHQLAQHPDVPIRPSSDREDAWERLAALNHEPAEAALAAIAKVLGRPLGDKR